MDCKQIGQYVLLCDNTNWYFDNDSNGMSYFIYKPTDTKYSMVMAPQSCCCGCNNAPNIEFGTNAQVIQSTIDVNEAQEWLNSLVNNNFMGMVAVPTYIKQYESIRKYFNAVNSSRFTESDLHYLEENMYKAYHITEQSFINYVNYYSEHYEYNAEFENVDHFVEGFGSTIAKFLAGKSGKTGFASTGLLAMLPMIVSKIPGLGQYASLLRGALCIAKVWAGIKMAQASPKYLSSDKKGRVLMIAGSIASQVLQCFAVLKGRRFLTGIINKLSMVVANLAVKKEPAAVLAATTAAAATSSAIADAGLTDTSVIEELHNPDISIDEKVELLKDADVPEEKITAITKAVETETAAEATLKSEAVEAVNKANQEQIAAAATEKQQPVENNVNSVEQASTEVASSQPVENTNNEQVAITDSQQTQPAETTNNKVDFQTVLNSPEVMQMCQAAQSDDPEVQEQLKKLIMDKIHAEQFVVNFKKDADEYNFAQEQWDNGPKATTLHYHDGLIASDGKGSATYDLTQAGWSRIDNSMMKWQFVPADAKAAFISGLNGGKSQSPQMINVIEKSLENQKLDAEGIRLMKLALEADKKVTAKN